MLITTIRILLALIASCACVSNAQDYPTRPIRLVTPVAAGGGADATVRMLANQLTNSLRQRVVVDNRTGGAGVIATQELARSAPDGHTILLASMEIGRAHVLTPVTQ